jgi:DNA-directed RNA polymerase subunit M/transcription elongation factor TFIIS
LIFLALALLNDHTLIHQRRFLNAAFVQVVALSDLGILSYRQVEFILLKLCKNSAEFMSQAKQQTTGFLKCRHCGNYAPMNIAASYYLSTKPELYYPEDEYYNPQPNQGYNYELLLCLACKKVTLREYFEHDYMDPEDIKLETLYPPQGVKSCLPAFFSSKRI